MKACVQGFQVNPLNDVYQLIDCKSEVVLLGPPKAKCKVPDKLGDLAFTRLLLTWKICL